MLKPNSKNLHLSLFQAAKLQNLLGSRMEVHLAPGFKAQCGMEV